MKINDIAYITTTKSTVNDLYVTTDTMLANFNGIVPYKGNFIKKATEFKENDILLSNIRPYFKKLWIANKTGNCSSDIICLRSFSKLINPKYLFYFLSQDYFFNRYIRGCIGSKMPRGNKDILLNFPIKIPSTRIQFHIVDIIKTEK